MMKTILFATTNKNKIARLKNFIQNDKLNIISLDELGYHINEPEESGSTPSQIAANKALYYWSKLKVKIPVLAQDDTIEFLGVKELAGKRLSIKTPVVKEYGEFNDENAIKFYTSIANKYGGEIKMRFNYGFAICVDGKAKSRKAVLNCKLVNQVSKIIDPGYFLTSIMRVEIDNKIVFYSELSLDQQARIDNSLARAVSFLLK